VTRIGSRLSHGCQLGWCLETPLEGIWLLLPDAQQGRGFLGRSCVMGFVFQKAHCRQAVPEAGVHVGLLSP
jgi:hypothetical protein